MASLNILPANKYMHAIVIDENMSVESLSVPFSGSQYTSYYNSLFNTMIIMDHKFHCAHIIHSQMKDWLTQLYNS